MIRKRAIKITEYQEVFGSDVGKRILYDLMKRFHILGPSYVIGDSQSTSYNEGQRSVVLHLMNQMMIDPEKLMEEIRRQEDGN